MFVLVAILAGLIAVASPLSTAWTQERGFDERRGQSREPMGKQLIENLGCVVCHTLEGHTTAAVKEAPDLSYEGDKVRPEWLFSFLKQPHGLRPWLNARMPNFRLSDREAFAVTEYIRQALRDQKAPPLPAKMRFTGAVEKGLVKAAEQLTSNKYLDCFSCHMVGDRKPEGPRDGWAPDLSLAAGRLNPDWIVRWLLDPQKIQPGTKMPSYFTDSDSGPSDILDGDENRQILALRGWLLQSGVSLKTEGYSEAKTRYTDVNPGEGGRLVEELNCRGCHRIPGLPEARKVAPVLSYAGSKFRREWLVGFMKSPHPLRPAGYILGWRSRMPDFRLSDEEAKAIADYLMALTSPGLAQGVVREEKALSRIERFQASKLFEKTEGCIGCHRAKDRRGEVVGGLSGPDLSEVGKRLQGDFIYGFIRTPRVFEPQGKMEIFGDFLSDKDARTLAEYLSSVK
ncbi:MAG: c-type cytochrome [Candidatus Methylomirabilis oxyfera]|nr:c-type cytochrome [Candidatus Methylomirabilis oxyfera]